MTYFWLDLLLETYIRKKKNEVEEEEKNETFLSGVRFWELLCGLFVHDVYRKMYAFENQHTNEKAQTNNSS